jgi:hypothetical protein
LHRTSKLKEEIMDTLAVAVAGLGSGLPQGTVIASIGTWPSPAELVAGLGAFAFATLGVILVRFLTAPSDLPEAPEAAPDPRGDHLERAA